LCAAVAAAAVPSVMAFTLLGPGGAQGIAEKAWQLPGANAGWDIGYDRGGDIGAPVQPLEFYRLNIPLLTYAYDSEFRRFFGTNGIKAVNDAFRILNELPPASRMSDDLSEFPLSATQVNHEAAQLGLIDLKSVALSALVEEMGLADSIRWTFAIRRRVPVPGTTFGVYDIIKFNYDPVTLQPSSYVNGNLWTYFIEEFPAIQTSDAREVRPPGLENEPLNIPVASLHGFRLLSGFFHTGLTRDDVGGLRYLYRPRNVVVETLLTGTTPGAGSAWIPFIGTNFLGSNVVITNIIGTNNIATAGLRGGIDKVRFQQVHFDSILGQGFTPITNQYVDRVTSTNSQLVSQVVRRPILVPDIILTVEDIFPTLAYQRTDTASWINNDLINGFSAIGGPGVIAPPIVITFAEQAPVLNNQTPFFITEPIITDTNSRLFGLIGPTWASFDGTTNPPVIYPAYLNYTIAEKPLMRSLLTQDAVSVRR
jgi:hypothetical protein